MPGYSDLARIPGTLERRCQTLCLITTCTLVQSLCCATHLLLLRTQGCNFCTFAGYLASSLVPIRHTGTCFLGSLHGSRSPCSISHPHVASSHTQMRSKEVRLCLWQHEPCYCSLCMCEGTWLTGCQAHRPVSRQTPMQRMRRMYKLCSE